MDDKLTLIEQLVSAAKELKLRSGDSDKDWSLAIKVLLDEAEHQVSSK